MDLITSKDDSLTKKMSKHVVNTDKLKTPSKRVKDVCFLGHELIVVIRDTDEVQQLVDPWVGFLEVLGRNEDASKSDQRDNVGFGLASKMSNTCKMLFNFGSLEVSIENVYAVMEGFWLNS